LGTEQLRSWQRPRGSLCEEPERAQQREYSEIFSYFGDLATLKAALAHQEAPASPSHWYLNLAFLRWIDWKVVLPSPIADSLWSEAFRLGGPGIQFASFPGREGWNKWC
jgi:mannosyl-3-phosphoglycerate phosphatase